MEKLYGSVHWCPPPSNVPPWMEDTYQVYYRDPHEVVCSIVANPDFATELDYSLYREYVTETNDRRWCDFMSGDWAWNQAVSVIFIEAQYVLSTYRTSSHKMLTRMALYLC